MTELTLTLIKVAFLAVLWLFVLAAVGVIRADLRGPRQSAAIHPPAHGGPMGAPAPPPPAKGRRGQPTHAMIVQGPAQGFTMDLQGIPFTIGRGNEATLALNDDYASGRHARLFPQNGQWFVEDLGSTNGTFLDRNKVHGPTPVSIGVPIRIGKSVIELRK